MVSMVNNVDIVIVVSTLYVVSKYVNSAQYCKSHVMYANKNC